MWFNPKEIADIVTKRCPQAEDINVRFERLYKRFGNNKTVPFEFVDGDVINWKQIYRNFDYLLEK